MRRKLTDTREDNHQMPIDHSQGFPTVYFGVGDVAICTASEYPSIVPDEIWIIDGVQGMAENAITELPIAVRLIFLTRQGLDVLIERLQSIRSGLPVAMIGNGRHG